MKALVQKSGYADVKEKYILSFFIHPDPDCKERIRKYSDAMKLPVWSVQMTTPNRFGADKRILGADVADFLALLANAALVITDSFHGVALSLNLQKDFVAFTNSANPVRVKQLLETLDIAERLDMPADSFTSVDYKRVDSLLQPLAEDSRRWVVNQIEGEDHE